MNKKNKIMLFLVDDDALYLRALEIDFIQHADFEIKTFATGELCIENLNSLPDVIILDYQLDSILKSAMNGIETLDKNKSIQSGYSCCYVIISG
jgi:DNA-binding NarL/FixJ family response regulator